MRKGDSAILALEWHVYDHCECLGITHTHREREHRIKYSDSVFSHTTQYKPLPTTLSESQSTAHQSLSYNLLFVCE